MTRWLKKVGKFADNVIDKVADEVKDQVSDSDWAETITTIKSKGQECVRLSRETMEICETTATKRQNILEFCKEIQSTLTNLKSGGDASILETIQDLTSQKRVQEATELAKGLDEVALACVDKSTKMIDLMEEGMDSLPAFVQSTVEKYGDNDENEDDDEALGVLEGLDKDLQDVETCVKSIQQLNLKTAMIVGLEAFTQLAEKAKRSQTLFDNIHSFASDVQGISQAFQDMNPKAVVTRSKDILHCLQVSDQLRLIAVGAGKLVKVIIKLFEATAERISVLWTALKFAKDCMTDCIQGVRDAQQLCVNAKDKSVELITRSLAVKDGFASLGDLNMQSVQAARSLASKDGDMQKAINLASTMDDLVLECSQKFVAMVNRVQEGYNNIPDILTQDIVVAEAGSGRADDPEPADVEGDIGQLQEVKVTIEESDVITASRAAVTGFGSVSQKGQVCQDLVDMVQQFAVSCDTTISSFLSVWDLESATTKITEMCQLVNLGELIQQFASQIRGLLVAILDLLKAALDKFSNLSFGSVAASAAGALDAAKERVEDRVDALKDQMKDKLEFWKN